MENLQNAKHTFVTFAAINASLGFFLYYYAISVFNSIQEALEIYVFPEASMLERSLFASSPFIGGTIGALIAELIANKFGRRSTMIIAGVISVIGVVFTMIKNIPLFITGRILIGLNGGASAVLANIYITEISEDPLRGQLGVVPNIAGALSTLVAFLAGQLMPYFVEHDIAEAGCRLLLGIPAIISLVQIFNLLFLFDFETPFYLVTQDKALEAKEVLKLLYQYHHTYKLGQIINEKDFVYEEIKVPIKDVLLPSGKFWKAFIASAPLVLSTPLMGGVVPFVYSNMVLSEGMESQYSRLPLVLTTLIGVFNFLGSLIALAFIKHIGRRTLAIIGGCLIAILNVTITFIIKIDSIANMGIKMLLLIWMLIFSATIQPLGVLYPAEVLPEVGVGILNTIGSTSSFLMIQVFMYLYDGIGYFGLYSIFTTCALIGLTIIFVYIVETKDKSKLEAYALYAKNSEEERGSLIID